MVNGNSPQLPRPKSGACANSCFSTAVEHLHQSSTLENWTPVAKYAPTPPSIAYTTLMPEMVIAVGSATNNRRFFYFEGLYDEFIVRETDDPAVLKAFIQALTFRRCKAVELLQSIIGKILKNSLLDAEDFEDLASLIADLGNRVLLDAIMQRTKGQRQRAGFYCHLLRCATEQINPPDIRTAIHVVQEMTNVEASWTDATMYYLIGGFAKTKRISFDAIFRAVQTYQSSVLHREEATDDATLTSTHQRRSFETSTIHQILGACERATGDDVDKALKVLGLIPTDDQWKCISLVTTHRDFKKPTDEDCVYFVVDPLSIDLQALLDYAVPPKTYYLFLFSAIRGLCEKAQIYPESHPIFTSKISLLKTLFEAHPSQFIVVPPEIELHIRGSSFGCSPGSADTTPPLAPAGPAGSLPSNGGVAQIIAFALNAITRGCQVGRSLRVLSSNPVVIRELTPLTTKYPASWFCICDKVSAAGSEGHRI